MREITSHKTNALNEALTIEVLDEPGEGGACHRYAIDDNYPDNSAFVRCHIHFQEGSVDKAGVNGISNEVLMAIVADRLIGFQKGPFASRENAVALTYLQTAMLWLAQRSKERAERGVEGSAIK